MAVFLLILCIIAFLAGVIVPSAIHTQTAAILLVGTAIIARLDNKENKTPPKE